MNDPLVGILGGGAAGLFAGFVSSVLVLQLRRLRTARLLARGGAPLEDAILRYVAKVHASKSASATPITTIPMVCTLFCSCSASTSGSSGS